MVTVVNLFEHSSVRGFLSANQKQLFLALKAIN